MEQSYAQTLHDKMFKVTRDSFLILGGNDDIQNYKSVVSLRENLAKFTPKLVHKYQSKYNELLRKHRNDINAILRGINNQSKAELNEFMGDSRISTFVNHQGNRLFFGSNNGHTAPPQSITIRKHSVGYFSRSKYDDPDLLLDRVIKLDESTKESKVSVMALLRTFGFEQKRLF